MGNRALLLLILCLLTHLSQAKTYKHSNKEQKKQNYYFDERNFDPNAVDGYSQANAEILGRLCNIVYENKKTIGKIFDSCGHIGTKINFDFYHDAGQSTEYMFVELKGRLIICFRGSESLLHFTGRGSAAKDWFGSDRLIPISNLFSNLLSKEDTNSKRYLKYNIPNGQKGFRKRVRQMIDNDFYRRLDAFAAHQKIDLSKGVFITGHSLGAALAQLIIVPITKKYPGMKIESVYLFAPPLAVNCKTAERIQQQLGKRIHNIVCERDYVVRGQLRGEAANMGYYYRIVADTLSRTNKQYIQARWDMINTLFGPGYHHLESYLGPINKPHNSSDLVNVYRPYPIGFDTNAYGYRYPRDSNLWKPLNDMDEKCDCDKTLEFNPKPTSFRQRYILNGDSEEQKGKRKKGIPNPTPTPTATHNLQ